LRLQTQAADLYGERNDASVLVAPAPSGHYVLETQVGLDLPAQDCCRDPVQAGIVIYNGDDSYVKLVHVALENTRQIELGIEVPTGSAPRYGNAVLGAPAKRTWLRLAVRRGAGADGADLVTGYSSQDGRAWVRGASFSHAGAGAPRIGLVAMGGAGFPARFDYVRVYRMTP